MAYNPRRPFYEWLRTGNAHVRTGAPDTSFDAVPDFATITAQMRRVLYAYADGNAYTDHDAYHRVGMHEGVNGARQRCTDLRRFNLIERTGLRGRTPSGKTGYLCVITPLGRKYLEKNDWGEGPYDDDE